MVCRSADRKICRPCCASVLLHRTETARKEAYADLCRIILENMVEDEKRAVIVAFRKRKSESGRHWRTARSGMSMRVRAPIHWPSAPSLVSTFCELYLSQISLRRPYLYISIHISSPNFSAMSEPALPAPGTYLSSIRESTRKLCETSQLRVRLPFYHLITERKSPQTSSSSSR